MHKSRCTSWLLQKYSRSVLWDKLILHFLFFFLLTLEYLSECDVNIILHDFGIILIETGHIIYNGIYLRRKKETGKVVNKFGEVTLEIKENEITELWKFMNGNCDRKHNFVGPKWRLIECTLISSPLKSCRWNAGTDQRREGDGDRRGALRRRITRRVLGRC